MSSLMADLITSLDSEGPRRAGPGSRKTPKTSTSPYGCDEYVPTVLDGPPGVGD